jgi:hypothetical protein
LGIAFVVVFFEKAEQVKAVKVVGWVVEAVE